MGNGHFHIQNGGHLQGGPGSIHPLDHILHTGLDFRPKAAAAQLLPHIAIAAQGAVAGGNQIPQAGQAGKGSRLRPGGYAEAGYFGQAPADKSGFAVGPQVQPVGNARAQGNDVFQRPTQFHADHIIAGIDPESGRKQPFLHIGGSGGGRPGHHRGRRLFLRHFPGQVGAGQDADIRMAGRRQFLGQDLTHPQAAGQFQALGGAEDDGIRG